jgi:hypothetical protein
MSLRERIRKAVQSEREENAKNTAASETAESEHARKAKSIQEELTIMAQEASEVLEPILDVVNEERFNRKGNVEVHSFGPFLKGTDEYMQPYVDAVLGEPDTQFMLRLRLDRARCVKVLGTNESIALGTVKLNEGGVPQKLEEAILHAMFETQACYPSKSAPPNIDQ